MTDKSRIAHLSGSNATIQNTPALVTSNKARAKHGLPTKSNPDGTPARFDVLRPQRLAAPAKVYVEQFSAHPLERDAAELYWPPDGYLDVNGCFNVERQSEMDVPVYEVELLPEDGLYPLPYMARRADGSPWEAEGTMPLMPASWYRQPFFPDGSRCFEEIDRLSVDPNGWGNMISSRADIDFYRVLPPAGYKKGLSEVERTDVGIGDIAPETLGKDFFPYQPYHIAAAPPRVGLASIVNRVQEILDTGRYMGAIWTQGSPRIEETMYWFNLLLDTTLPMCGNCSQRSHGEISNDGPKNLVDSVEYLTSRVWTDGDGRNRAGMVIVQEQQIFAAREAQKGDARPGGFVTTGGHGGLLGAVGHGSAPVLTYLPGSRNTYNSEVNISRLPSRVRGTRCADGHLVCTEVAIKGEDGRLLSGAIPKVTIVKDGSYMGDDFYADTEPEVDIIAQIDWNLKAEPLAGFVVEGLSPYGLPTSKARHQLMLRAVLSGMPVVCVGRGNNDGFTSGQGLFIGGSNLTATKARLLLMACLMRFGSLPPVADLKNPKGEEVAAIHDRIALYQNVFDTH